MLFATHASSLAHFLHGLVIESLSNVPTLPPNRSQNFTRQFTLLYRKEPCRFPAFSILFRRFWHSAALPQPTPVELPLVPPVGRHRRHRWLSVHPRPSCPTRSDLKQQPSRDILVFDNPTIWVSDGTHPSSNKLPVKTSQQHNVRRKVPWRGALFCRLLPAAQLKRRSISWSMKV